MSRDDWRELLETLQVDGTVNPSTDEELDAYEETSGFRLPQGYRDYCCEFGSGLLTNWEYLIAVPACAAGGETTLDGIDRRVREFAVDHHYCQDSEQFERGVFFCEDTFGNSLVFWDPQDVTRESENEYGVYVAYRNYEVDRLADTFEGFIRRTCLEVGFPQGYSYADGIAQTFLPTKL